MNPVPGNYKQHVHDTDETVHRHGRVGDHAIIDCAPDFCGLDATLATKTEPIPLWPADHGNAVAGRIIHEAPPLHPCKPGRLRDKYGRAQDADVAPGSRWQCNGCREIWYFHGSGEWRRTLRADSTVDLGFEDQPEQPMPRWMRIAFMVMALLSAVALVAFIVTVRQVFE